MGMSQTVPNFEFVVDVAVSSTDASWFDGVLDTVVFDPQARTVRVIDGETNTVIADNLPVSETEGALLTGWAVDLDKDGRADPVTLYADQLRHSEQSSGGTPRALLWGMSSREYDAITGVNHAISSFTGLPEVGTRYRDLNGDGEMERIEGNGLYAYGYYNDRREPFRAAFADAIKAHTDETYEHKAVVVYFGQPID